MDISNKGGNYPKETQRNTVPSMWELSVGQTNTISLLHCLLYPIIRDLILQTYQWDHI